MAIVLPTVPEVQSSHSGQRQVSFQISTCPETIETSDAFQDKHAADVDLLLEPLLQSTLAGSVCLPLPPGNRQGQGALQQAAPPDAAPDAADF